MSSWMWSWREAAEGKEPTHVAGAATRMSMTPANKRRSSATFASGNKVPVVYGKTRTTGKTLALARVNKSGDGDGLQFRATTKLWLLSLFLSLDLSRAKSRREMRGQ